MSRLSGVGRCRIVPGGCTTTTISCFDSWGGRPVQALVIFPFGISSSEYPDDLTQDRRAVISGLLAYLTTEKARMRIDPTTTVYYNIGNDSIRPDQNQSRNDSHHMYCLSFVIKNLSRTGKREDDKRRSFFNLYDIQAPQRGRVLPSTRVFTTSSYIPCLNFCPTHSVCPAS